MYFDENGWWWDVYGDDGQFSIWEFMAIMWAYEQQYYPYSKTFRTATANHAAVWCYAMSCNRASAEGSLNFLAAYSASASNRATNVLSGDRSLEDVFYKPPWNLSNGMETVQAIIYRQSIVFYPVKPSDLYDFGNVSLSNKILERMVTLGLLYSVWGEGDTFFVMTKCQSDLYQYAKANDGAADVNYRSYRQYCGG